MEWDDLKLVLAVGRLGSFSAAARAVGMTQPTIGRRFRQLEAKLGTRLLERGTVGHRLTDAGSALFVTATQVESLVLDAERRATGHDDRVEGLVKVTTVSFLATEIMIPVADRLRHDYPALELEVIGENRMLSLHRREADIALRPVAFRGNDILVRRAAEMVHGAYCGISHPEVGGDPPALLLPPENQWDYAEIAWLIESFPDSRVALRSDQRSVLLEAARRGLGVVSLPVIIGDNNGGLRRVIPSLGPARSLWLGAHRDMANVPRIRVVLDAITRLLTERRRDFLGER